MSLQWRLGQRLASHNLLVFVAVAFLLPGCSRSNNSLAQVTVEVEVSPQPAHVGPVKVDFKIKDGSGQPVTGARAKLEANMTHPGMAPVFAEAREVSPGLYSCPIELSMAGDWIILIRIILPDGQQLERQYEVRGVRSD
jgi:hypothetical protein